MKRIVAALFFSSCFCLLALQHLPMITCLTPMRTIPKHLSRLLLPEKQHFLPRQHLSFQG